MYRPTILCALFLGAIVTLSACKKEEVQPVAEPTPETTELLSPYTLEFSNSIGVPVSNPAGIASDGTNLWIMSGEHNGSEHELTYYDPVNYTILAQFTFTNLIETLGTGVYGVTWDGANVWISVSGGTNKLVKVDPQNGHILQTWSSPTSLGPSDLEWDGQQLWIATGTGQVYSMNTTSGGSALFLNHVGEADRDHGITFRNDELWVGNLFNTNVDIYNAIDGTYLGVIKTAISTNGQFCFHNGQLAVLSSGGIAFYDVIE